MPSESTACKRAQAGGQFKLFRPIPTARAVRNKVNRYAEQNREAAEVILQDQARYGGPESGAVRWARAFLAREAE